MALTRRGLFRLAFWSAAASVVARPFKAVARRMGFVRVGKGGDVQTLSEALAMVQDGGTIFLLPGIHEVHGPVDVPSGMTVIGNDSRPSISWRPS